MAFASSSHLLERRRLPTTQDEVEAITERPFSLSQVMIVYGHEALARVFAWNTVEDRVKG
jgi:hypothetical protein